jgi:hypothetical protein
MRFDLFLARRSVRSGESARPKSNHRTADAGSPGLTSRQRGDAFCIDRGRPTRHLHHFKTKARIAAPQ